MNDSTGSVNDSTIFFADRWILYALVPLLLAWAAGWFFLLPLLRQRRGIAAVRFSTLKQLDRLKPSWTVRLRRLVLALRLITLALLVLAMARPQTGLKLTKTSTEGVDIVLAIDTSGSMRALDLESERAINQRRNRLEVVLGVVDEFVQQRDSDQIGLVVFGAEAFTQCPLTLDHGIVATFLERLEIGMAGDATAIGSALGTAVKRLKDSTAKSKVIILLTDGRNNAGSLSPQKAAEIAKTFGIKVYTVGAGTRGKAPFIVETLLGKQVIYEDVEIDEATLQKIASTTGGAYFRAEDREALSEVYTKIDELEKTEITMESYMEYNERFSALVIPAILLLLLEVGLLGTRLRKLP